LNLTTWLKAARLPAQTFIIPALVLGQAFLFNQTQNFSLFWLILIQLYGLLMHFFIVFSNDYADYETDQLNQTYTPFTGGSRVLVEGNLSKQHLLNATWVTLALTLLVALALSFIHANGLIVALAGIGILIMHAYSFNPIKLSYRGFGETLQMLGVGVILPLVGYLGQGGSLSSFPWGLMLIFLPSQLAMAIGTALPDEPSDRLSSKKTSAVLFGVPNAQRLMIGLFALSTLLLLSVSNVHVPEWKWIGLVLLIGLQFSLFALKRPRPGEVSMFLLVTLSILTNTFLVAGFTSLLF
jgi:1,4-dihydroxy-2-naphthoate octaprenyltransferase